MRIPTLSRPFGRSLLLAFASLSAHSRAQAQATLSLPPVFRDVSATHLPHPHQSNIRLNSMDAFPADLDGDGDLDLVVAIEFGPNVLLVNDGSGKFTDESVKRLPQFVHDSEHIAVADLDGDGDLDIVFASEDDQVHELYLNDGKGFFTDASDRIGIRSESNAVLAADLDADGDIDLLFGNRGTKRLLLNDGRAQFTPADDRLPPSTSLTQDIQAADMDADGDLDLVLGNEDGNELWLNQGNGRFAAARLPLRPLEETRDAAFADIDNDGDLDLHFANVGFRPGHDPQNRLLRNAGNGVFTDVTADQLPQSPAFSLDARFADLDGDGDADLLVANAFNAPSQVLRNDGTGRFAEATAAFFASPPTMVVDIRVFDANGDGKPDLYFSRFKGPDALYFGQ